MDFEVYCVESRQDLIAKKQSGQYFMIDSLWLPANIREDVKAGITPNWSKNGGNYSGENAWLFWHVCLPDIF